MKIGDRIELKIDGRQGRLTGMEYDEQNLSYTGKCIITLDDGMEFIVMPLDIRRLTDKKKKEQALMKMVKRGEK